MTYFIAILISFSVSFFAIYMLIHLRFLHIAVDTPNHRSLHQRVVPRTGGIGLIIGILAGAAFLYYSGAQDGPAWWLFIIPLVLISFIDDMKGVPFYWRFAGHFLIAGLFLVFVLPHGFVIGSLFVLLIVWMTNLFNFMDGSDGLAGGMSMFGFAAYAVAAYFQNNSAFAVINAVIASASLGFLVFNFNPAKIFMGDGGSIPLGFLAAAIGLIGYQQQLWPCWFPIIVFSPFIVDATLTLLKRLFKGEKIWQAHRSHYYQRLVQMGLGHRKTALLEYCLMVFMAASAILGLYNSKIVGSLFVSWIAIYGLIIWIIDRKWRNFSA